MDRSTGFWWSPDGSKLAYQETDERHVPLYSIVHQGGTDLSIETHRYPFPGAGNARVRLGVVPVAGGETTWLQLPVPGDDFYLARVDWDGPAGLLVQILSRDQKHPRPAPDRRREEHLDSLDRGKVGHLGQPAATTSGWSRGPARSSGRPSGRASATSSCTTATASSSGP